MTSVSQQSDSRSNSDEQYISMGDEAEYARHRKLGNEDLSEDLDQLAMDTGYGIGLGGMP